MKKGMKQLISGILVLCMVITMMPIVPAKAEDMVEVTPNVATTDQLNSENDVKYYSFTVDKEGYFNINFSVEGTNESVGNGWSISLCDAANKKEIYSCTVKGNQTLPKFDFAKGTKLFVKIQANTAKEAPTKVPFKLLIRTVESKNWEKEWNNSKETANQIVGNQTYYGNLYSEEDVDYYSYTIAEDGYFTVDFGVNNSNSNGEWVVYIQDENTGMGLFNKTAYKSCSFGEFNFEKGTKLNIIILNKKYNKSTKFVTYNLTVREHPSKYWEKENRMSAIGGKIQEGLANDIELGKVYTGNLWKTYDHDYYKVTIPKDGYVTFKMKHKDSGYYIGENYDIEILSSDYKVIYSNSTNSENKTLYLKKGIYYIEISAGLIYTAPVLERYIVSAHFRAATPGKITSIKQSGTKVSWSKASNVSGYQVAYSTRKNFKGAVMKNTAKTFYNLSNLKKGSTYYVRVRSYKTTATGARVYGPWSSVVTVRR